MPNFNSRLFNQLRRLEPLPTSSLRRQGWAFWITVVGTIGTIILGIASFVIAVKVQHSAVRIELMDSLINQLGHENQTMTQSLATLTTIAGQNSKSINKLDSIQQQLFQQNRNNIINTEPRIQIITAESHKINESNYYTVMRFSNSGARDMKNLEISYYPLYEEGNRIKLLTKDGKSNYISVSPSQILNDRFDLEKVSGEIVRKLKFRIDFSYYDGLNHKPKTQVFYFEFNWTGGSQFVDSKELMKRMDTTISKQTKGRKP